MALFTQIPFALRDNGLPVGRHWHVYLPVLTLSIAIMLPFLKHVDHPGRIKPMLLVAIATLMTAQIALGLSLHSITAMACAMVLFFAALNLLEAMLPSLVSKCAPADARGAAIGVNSSLQFLGAFVGAAAGGWLAEHMGGASIFVLGVILTALWLTASATMSTPPQPYRSTYSMGET